MAEIVFYDETGLNPLPAGLFVTLYAAPVLPSFPTWRRVNNQAPLPLYDGVTTSEGVFINPTIVLQAGAQYGAYFAGVQVPNGCQALFVGAVSGNSTGNASNYRSPTLSQLGYTQAQTQLWPPKWYSDDALLPGGSAYALAFALAAILGSPIINGIVDQSPLDIDTKVPLLNNKIPNAGHWSLDAGTQVLLASERVTSSQGDDINSWALDILGNVFTRCIDETDYSWIQQILQILQIFRDPGLPTVAGLQAILSMLYPCIILEFQQKLAADNQGSTDNWGGLDVVPGQPGSASISLGQDTYGSMDTPTSFMDVNATTTIFETPNVLVFDAQSNPLLAGMIAPNIVAPQFCVYFQYPSFSDSLIHPIAPLIPELVALVDACKAIGTQVIYAANVT